jgi:hypothetical protein
MSMKLSAEMFNQIISTLKSDGTCSRGHEKRSEARVGLRCALEIVQCRFAVKEKPFIVHVHDISTNGIGLVSPVPMEEDAEFIARLNRDGRPAVPVLYRVKYCRRLSSDLSAIGAVFQRVLPDSQGEVQSLGRKKQPAKPPKPPAAKTPGLVETQATV